MANCPCCSAVLLRHIRAHQTYWFCRSCWQSMPDFDRANDRLSVSLATAIARTSQQLQPVSVLH